MYKKEIFRKYVIEVSIDLSVVFFFKSFVYIVILLPRDEPVILNVMCIGVEAATVDCFKPILTRSTFEQTENIYIKESNPGPSVNDRVSNQIPVGVHLNSGIILLECCI
jgi:hypothetical protein